MPIHLIDNWFYCFFTPCVPWYADGYGYGSSYDGGYSGRGGARGKGTHIGVLLSISLYFILVTYIHNRYITYIPIVFAIIYIYSIVNRIIIYTLWVFLKSNKFIYLPFLRLYLAFSSLLQIPIFYVSFILFFSQSVMFINICVKICEKNECAIKITHSFFHEIKFLILLK